MENEIWKDIEGYEGKYQVSSEGRVKTILRQNKVCDRQHVLKYGRVFLTKDSKTLRYPIDLLVGRAFLPKASVMECLIHKNGDRNDNRAVNLEWDTRTASQKYSDECRKRTTKGITDWQIEKDYIRFLLPNTKEYCLCDIQDWEQIKQYGWHKSSSGYVVGRVNGNMKRLHCFIMPHHNGYVVDHINHNKLDNRRKNLRYATVRVNTINRTKETNNNSGVFGVTKRKSGKYSAYIRYMGKLIWLGTYCSLNEAKAVREEAEEKYFKPIIEKETHI